MTEEPRRRGRPRKNQQPESSPESHAAEPTVQRPVEMKRTKSKRKKELELPPELAEAEHLTTASPAWKHLYAAISREFR